MRALLFACLLLASCAGPDEDDTVVTDSSIEDSASEDSGSTDTGSTDTGSTDTGIGPVDADGDGYTADVDCDDDPNGCGADCFPGNSATDDCDGNDNDCDNSIDEDTGTSWYPDCDGDGDFADVAVTGCTEPTQTNACEDGALPDGGFADTLPSAPDCDDEDATLNLADVDGDGFDTCTGDCDDDPDSCGSLCEPGATGSDLCDGFDTDCDGSVGEDDSRRWYADCDGDGFFEGVGVASCTEPSASPCSDGAAPDGGWTASLPTLVDCDDEDSALRPDDLDGDGVSSCDGDCDDDPGACGAACSPNLTTDGCDSFDNDCDGTSDENPDISWYLDADGDGSTVGTGTLQCESPGANYLPQPSAVEDCDDGDAGRDSLDRDSDGQTTCEGDCDDDPAACGDQCNTTIDLDGCDSFDNDCDNILDEDPGSTVWYLDNDQDGWVSDAPGIGQCVSPGANYTTRLSSVVDCDDTDADANYDDLDEDGFSTCEGDCDDDPAGCGADCFPANPALDTCDDADNDCDDALDEDPPTWYPDADRDGDTAATGEVAACDAPTTGGAWLTSPSAEADCDDTDAALNHDDADGDTVDTCAGDCDDNPLACGANCSPNNTLDECDVSSYNNDCDGQIDEDAPTWYLDDDQDGWSADATGQSACSAPGADWSQTLSSELDCDDGDAALNHDDADTDNVDTCAGDCNDGNGDIFPGAAEICDGDGTTGQQIDNDCDSGTNPDFTTWYTDLDGDGDGLAGSGVEYCLAQVADRSTSNTDCDDEDPDRAGIFTELCDGNGSPGAQFDNDCDSGTNPTTSDWYTDLDADGYGAETATAEAWCLDPTAGYAQSNDDCDDDPGACGDACNPGITLDTCDEATLGDGDWTNGVV